MVPPILCKDANISSTDFILCTRKIKMKNVKKIYIYYVLGTTYLLYI